MVNLKQYVLSFFILVLETKVLIPWFCCISVPNSTQTNFFTDPWHIFENKMKIMLLLTWPTDSLYLALYC